MAVATNEKCPWCGVNFAVRRGIATKVWNGQRECLSKFACTRRIKNGAKPGKV